MQQKFAVPLTLLVLLVGACNSAPIEVLPLPSPLDSSVPTVIPLSTAVPIVTSLPTASPTPTPWPTNTPMPSASVSQTRIDNVSLAGIIYQTHDGVWRVEATGDSARLLEHSVDYIFPDGSMAAYLRGGSFFDELWLVDLKTGQERNLIENLNLAVCCVVEWPSQSTSVLFGSWPLDNVGRSSGFLTAVRIDGSKLTILDKGTSFIGLPAASPDGKIIAYSSDAKGVLFFTGGTRQPFNPELYGVSADYLMAPAWSPNGKKIAWVTVQNGLKGVGVFDLAQHKARLFHAYRPTPDWTPTPAWSPDGKWLAFVAVADQASEGGLWIARVDENEQEERHLTDDLQNAPIWSPDSHWLISGDLLFEVGTWRSQPIALLPDAEVIGWVALSE